MKVLITLAAASMIFTTLSVFAGTFEMEAMIHQGQDVLTLKIKNTEPLIQVDVYNIIGKKVKSRLMYTQPEMQMSLKGLPDGIYFVKVHNSQESHIQKFIKN